jgi:hypothetical protein
MATCAVQEKMIFPTHFPADSNKRKDSSLTVKRAFVLFARQPYAYFTNGGLDCMAKDPFVVAAGERKKFRGGRRGLNISAISAIVVRVLLMSIFLVETFTHD